MKTVKVSIQDENTLMLLEDAQKGDLIDLKSIHETDIDKTSIDKLIKSIQTKEFKAQLDTAKLSIEKEKELEAEKKKNEIVEKAKEALTKKDQEIIELKTKLENVTEKIESQSKVKSLEERQKLEEEYRKKISEKEEEIREIKHKKELNEQKLQDQLQASEKALVLHKEMRSRMSTKMIGESLEIHCENEFNRIRSIAFPNAKFEKDNEVVDGSKGDYVYRETDEDGNELLSIMFEMKNEDENTASKHKNKDFFKKLDSDRTKKNCEFAVLVSLLEKDNEFYDDIVTVHEYEKMYSIRPQHFITIIGFLRHGSLKSQELQRTIQILKNQNIDVTNFETQMNAFKDAFSRNYSLASRQFSNAIDEIDKTIDHLNKVKENLLKSDNNLRLANNKATDLSIKRLTANSPSVAKAFEEQSNTQND